MAPRKLSQKVIEEMGDARLLLETAAHNLNVAIRQNAQDDSLATALELAEQATSALRRIVQAAG
jgi:hypothetical protein